MCAGDTKTWSLSSRTHCPTHMSEEQEKHSSASIRRGVECGAGRCSWHKIPLIRLCSLGGWG